VKFLSEVERLTKQLNANDFSNKVDEMKARCSNFLVALVAKVVQRMPADASVFRRLSALHSDKILSQTARLPFSELPYQHLMSADINVLYRTAVPECNICCMD